MRIRRPARRSPTGRTVPRRRAAGARTAPRSRTRRRKPSPKRALPRPGKRFWLSLLACIGVTAAGWGAASGWKALVAHPSLAVRQVSVAGTEALSEEEVLALAGVEPGTPWLALDRAGIRRRVAANGRVAEVRVRRPGIGRVEIHVEEFHPKARVRVEGHDYGLGPDLRILPHEGDDLKGLPLLTTTETGLEPDALARGLVYLAALERQGFVEERVEIRLAADGTDRIRLPGRGFSAEVSPDLSPATAARNVAAFLETLDGTGASRGTLRLISEDTAVWRAA